MANQQEKNNANGQDVTVTRVIDGDTLVVRFSNQSIATIRLLGVDCPETSLQHNNPNEYQNITNLSCLTYYGNQAKNYVISLLNNSQISISFDEQAQKKDRYDRFLCYVTFESFDFNAQLVEEGYARVYTLETFSKKSNYLSLQEKAIEQNSGLWGCSSFDSQLIIESVHYDAAGNDENNLNDEYVVLLNTDDKTIDLSGWSMHDEHGNMFYFPNGFRLTPQHSVTVYTGSGTNMTTALYWYHKTPVWNNAGDTVFILNEKNDNIVTYSW
ncbi:MAG TPA: lamin tail domain-containing protein [Candidatus Thermoplasmatota archaeon]|nr:lamin tail domain-containing protein [Candidatus Thermoplasmatota archaeon]